MGRVWGPGSKTPWFPKGARSREIEENRKMISCEKNEEKAKKNEEKIDKNG